MKITLDVNKENVHEEIIIKCSEMTQDIIKIISVANRKKIMGSIDKQIFILEPSEVFYFESVDDKVYIYTEDQVYDCALKLYEIEEQFASDDFLRANKSTIINLSKVKMLNPVLNGKIEVQLENEEKQMI
ncbi:MAG: LytTR family DNA-binding domain-containing protein [Christensenellaceae bacterium]